jgi:CDP-glycerol glycerophosphotransferase (TagB/SpsB family)
MAMGIPGWLLLAPLVALLPKRRDWIAVIGRADGQFLDNCKYFFAESAIEHATGMRIAFISERDDVCRLVSNAGLTAYRYPGLQSLSFLLRAGTAVVDSVEWYTKGRCYLLAGTRVVQLWHGVGFKRIEFDKWRNEAKGNRLFSSPALLWARLLSKRLRGRTRKYDAVVTTSVFYRDNVFAPALRSRQVITTGYPRNSFGMLSAAANKLISLNTDAGVRDKLHQWHETGRRVVVIAPTYRDTRPTTLGLTDAIWRQLEAFGEEKGFEFLFKFHPYERQLYPGGGGAGSRGKHLHVLDPCSDIYPFLPYTDALVTDYSSIYMDYLLLDRPVIFLVEDLEQYLASDRDVQFDFEQMTPGPKLRNWDEVMRSLANPETDAWKARRNELRKLAFDDTPGSGATARLLAFMRHQGWVEPLRQEGN